MKRIIYYFFSYVFPLMSNFKQIPQLDTLFVCFQLSVALTASHIKASKVPHVLLCKVGHTFALGKHCPSLRLFEELLTPWRSDF